MLENNLTLPIEKQLNTFQLEMLTKNRIPGILPITQVEECFSIDTKGYMPLKTYLESHTITVKTFKMLLECFLSIMEDSLLYYLNWNNFLLSSEHLFISADIQSLALVYLPIDDEEETSNPIKTFIVETLLVNGKFNMEEDWNFMILGLNTLNSAVLTTSHIEVLYEVFQLRAGTIVESKHTVSENKDLTKEGNGEKVKKIRDFNFFKKLVKDKADPYIKKEDSNTSGKTVLLKKQMTGLKLVAEDSKFTDINVSNNNIVIGRHKKSVDVFLNDPSIGKYHAEIIVDKGQYYIRDLNSLNGSYLNDEKIPSYETKLIKNMDRVAFANLIYKVKNYD